MLYMSKILGIRKDKELGELLALCPSYWNISEIAREILKKGLKEKIKYDKNDHNI